MNVAPGASDEDVRVAVESLVSHLMRPVPGVRRRHDLEIETIDGASATKSAHASAFVQAGFRRDGLTLRKPVDFSV